MNRPAKTLLVVPAYNCAPTVEALIDRVRDHWRLECTLFIDDGSADGTGKALHDCGVTFIRFGQNKGKGAALKAGYRWATANGYTDVVTMDADLQHNPAEIEELLKRHVETRADVTVGTRFPGAPGMPHARRLSNFLTSLVVSIFSKKRIRDCQSGFRAVNVYCASGVSAREDGFMFESEQLFVSGSCGVRVAEAPIRCVYDSESSHIHPLRDTLRFFGLIWRRMWY